MKLPLFRTLVFTLALAICAAPVCATPAFAGQTVIIDSDPGNSVVGNSPELDHTWDRWNDNPADLLDPNGNKVIVNSDVSGDVDGADAVATGSDDAAATGNSVTINGGTVDDYVDGGHAGSEEGSAAATGNSVTINDGEIGWAVHGGSAYSDSGSATATGNSVTINNGSTVDSDVSGGYAESSTGSAAATGNSVTINSGSMVDGSVYGGYAYSEEGSATATGNSVTINSGSMVDYDVYGGYAESEEGSATASGNSVTINGGDVGYDVYGGYAESSTGSAAATGNSVTINSGQVDDDVYGGDASASNGNATSANNSVIINGGQVDNNVYGGYASSDSGSATAKGNVVTINSGSTVGGDVYGGYADSDGEDMSGDATHNSVVIRDSTVDGDVYGGYSLVDVGDELGTATHNSVTISGAATFTDDDSIYGGFVGDSGGTPETSMDAFTGNTLNIWNYTGTSTLHSVQNFEFYNFVIPVTQGADPVLKADEFFLAESPTGRASTIAVNTLGGTDPMSVGSFILLMDGDIYGNDDVPPTFVGKHGATLAYDWAFYVEGDLLVALDGVAAHPQAKALSEGFLSGLALSTQGADVVAGAGMVNAVNAVSGAASETDGTGAAGTAPTFAAFGALSGGLLRYNTGSHIDMNSVSLLAGMAKGWNSADFAAESVISRLTVGAFFEYGNGSYDTHNSFSNAASVDSNGDTYYFGGGLLGRMDFVNSGAGNWYAEGSLRLGSIHNDYNGGDLTDGMGRSADFDSSALYYGLHLGGGYVWNLNEAASLDFYGKYFWTHQQGEDVTLATNDPVSFDSVNSHRVRLGGRFAYAVNDTFSPYVGAAYEYEFDGKAKASTYGYDIDAPELKGGTGIGEIGLSFTPFASGANGSAGVDGANGAASTALPLSFDLGLQGYVGVREGVTGSLQVRFEF